MLGRPGFKWAVLASVAIHVALFLTVPMSGSVGHARDRMVKRVSETAIEFTRIVKPPPEPAKPKITRKPRRTYPVVRKRVRRRHVRRAPRPIERPGQPAAEAGPTPDLAVLPPAPVEEASPVAEPEPEPQPEPVILRPAPEVAPQPQEEPPPPEPEVELALPPEPGPAPTPLPAPEVEKATPPMVAQLPTPAAAVRAAVPAAAEEKPLAVGKGMGQPGQPAAPPGPEKPRLTADFVHVGQGTPEAPAAAPALATRPLEKSAPALGTGGGTGSRQISPLPAERVGQGRPDVKPLPIAVGPSGPSRAGSAMKPGTPGAGGSGGRTRLAVAADETPGRSGRGAAGGVPGDKATPDLAGPGTVGRGGGGAGSGGGTGRDGGEPGGPGSGGTGRGAPVMIATNPRGGPGIHVGPGGGQGAGPDRPGGGRGGLGLGDGGGPGRGGAGGGAGLSGGDKATPGGGGGGPSGPPGPGFGPGGGTPGSGGGPGGPGSGSGGLGPGTGPGSGGAEGGIPGGSPQGVGGGGEGPGPGGAPFGLPGGQPGLVGVPGLAGEPLIMGGPDGPGGAGPGGLGMLGPLAKAEPEGPWRWLRIPLAVVVGGPGEGEGGGAGGPGGGFGGPGGPLALAFGGPGQGGGGFGLPPLPAAGTPLRIAGAPVVGADGMGLTQGSAGAKSAPGGLYVGVAGSFDLPMGVTTSDYEADAEGMRNLLSEVRNRTNVHVTAQERFVPLTLDNIKHLPVVHLRGHKPFSFTPEERETLRQYVAQGGTIFGEDSHGPFGECFRREMKSIFGESPRDLGQDHEVFRSYYVMDRVPAGDMGERYPLQGIKQGDRLAVIFSRNDYGDCWEGTGGWVRPESREPAFKMGVNIFVYIVAHWKKVKQ